MSEPAPSPGELNIARTASQALGVVRRQWVALVVLTLLFEGAPMLVFWQVYGFPPDVMGGRLTAVQRLPYLLISFVIETLLLAATTRVVLADRLQGVSLNPRQALALAPALLPGLFAAYAVVYAPGVALDVFTDVGGLPGLLYLAASLAVVLLYAVLNAFLGSTVSVVMQERVGGWTAVRRAFELGKGRRGALINGFALVGAAFFIGQWLLDNTLSLTLISAAGVSLPMVSAIRSLVWTGVGWAIGVFYAAWFPCLYLALRKASEGLGEDEIEVFS